MKKLCAGVLCVLLLGLCACARQAAPEETTQATAPVEISVNYFDMVWGWECPAGKFASYIDQIYHTEHGTAGSSGKAARSAVTLLELSKAYAQSETEELTSTFASMNDAQARFFASQWIRLFALASYALDDPAQFHESYDWAGLEDFDAPLYSVDDLSDLNDAITMVLCREEML